MYRRAEQPVHCPNGNGAGLFNAPAEEGVVRLTFDERLCQLLADTVEALPHYGSFYEHLPLEIAEQLRKKIRFIYTPKHGSWLNLTEIEFAALAGQCLDGRRIPSLEGLDKGAQWAAARNVKGAMIYWSFTTAKAREKFQRTMINY